MHIFAEARGVVEALHARDCGPALAWCDANKPKLKKIRSSLEFQLRVQVRARARVTRGLSCWWRGSNGDAGHTTVLSSMTVPAVPKAA